MTEQMREPIQRPGNIMRARVTQLTTLIGGYYKQWTTPIGEREELLRQARIVSRVIVDAIAEKDGAEGRLVLNSEILPELKTERPDMYGLVVGSLEAAKKERAEEIATPRVSDEPPTMQLPIVRPEEAVQEPNPVDERFAKLTEVMDPRPDVDERGEVPMFDENSRILAGEILDVMKSEPDGYAFVYHALRRLRADPSRPNMHQRVAVLLNIVQAERIEEAKAQRTPLIPGQRLPVQHNVYSYDQEREAQEGQDEVDKAKL